MQNLGINIKKEEKTEENYIKKTGKKALKCIFLGFELENV